MRRRHWNKGELAFQAANYTLLALLSLLFLVPLLAIVSTSLVGETELMRRGASFWFPTSWTSPLTGSCWRTAPRCTALTGSP
ncbi:hypothetical protein N6H14_13815 [Paenibacillus sp. CC-CFT747]|nr:hypothetical protein N6H14_13815 [Paenibacillus sp. CC-CFT747]